MEFAERHDHVPQGTVTSVDDFRPVDMPAPHSFAAKSPIPVYALALARDDVLIYAGGGGQSRSGITNAIRSATIEFNSNQLTQKSEVKLSNEEDAPMCIALSPEEGDVGASALATGPSERQIVAGINSPVTESGVNENLRLFEWTSTGKRQEQAHSRKADSDGERSDEKKRTNGTEVEDVHTLKSIKRAPSILIKDAEDYIKCCLTSPDGNYLAIGGTDGQFSLHSFPSLERIWHASSATGGEIIDATFSADSALIAFVTPNAIQIYPTKSSGNGEKAPKMYQSIRNPSLKGTTGCAFRAARFGRNRDGKAGTRSSRLFTVVNTNPPAGLGSSKKDRDKAKIRKCFISSWDVKNWALIQTRQVSERPSTVMEISEDGRHLALSTSDLSIHLLSTTTLKTIWRIKDAHAFPGTCLAFSPCGQTLASGSADMSLRLVRLAEVETAATLSDALHGRAATLALALLLAFTAWYLQRYLIPRTA